MLARRLFIFIKELRLLICNLMRGHRISDVFELPERNDSI